MAKKTTSKIIKDEEEDKKLRLQWSKMFLENEGFTHILKQFMEIQDSSLTSEDSNSGFGSVFNLKYIAFMIKILRIFIMAAFSTVEKENFEEANLIRKSSFDDTQKKAESHCSHTD